MANRYYPLLPVEVFEYYRVISEMHIVNNVRPANRNITRKMSIVRLFFVQEREQIIQSFRTQQLMARYHRQTHEQPVCIRLQFYGGTIWTRTQTEHCRHDGN